MEQLILRKPDGSDEADVLCFKKEFLSNGDHMDGAAGLADMEDYGDWLRAMEENSKKETVRAGLVPAFTFLCLRTADNRIVGIIDIRHELNERLLNFGGHIGYSVRKSERRKGYAKEMLRLGLAQCKPLRLERVLVTCDRENTGSAKTILANGGVLENEVLEDGRVTQRYWIDVR